jgi:5-methylcytosine-specific restriction protein A
MVQAWSEPIGTLMSRDERASKYGGSTYGGIEESAKTPNVFIYSDPSVSAKFGYNFDGWSCDDSIFLYTGEGPEGDQVMTNGNLALFMHKGKKRSLRLFIADGFVAKNTKNHRYIGEFETDQDSPYTIEDSLDKKAQLRTVFVFRLRPIGSPLRREADRSSVSNFPQATQHELTPIEKHLAATFITAGVAPSTSERRESELVQRYLEYHKDRAFKRWKLTPLGTLKPLLTDIYDEAANELYEAKGSSTREAVRQGIGQLLDYRRHIPDPAPKLSMLLPHEPNNDLVDLLRGLSISCVYEEPSGA